MVEPIFAGATVSIGALKQNPSAVIEAANGMPVAVLDHDRPSAYLVPASAWEEIMDRLEDIELAEIVRQRAGQEEIEVSIDEL